MNRIIIRNSDKANKKFKAEVFNKDKLEKVFYFGASGFSDFTINKDERRRSGYIKRHQKNENWNEVNAGSLSRFLLWEETDMKQAAKKFEKKFNIKVILDIKTESE